MEEDWAEKRRQNALTQARRLREREAAESAQASQYLAQFVAAARRERLEPEPLFVQSGDGRRAKTGLMGWYLKADRSVAVSNSGDFYLLTAPLTLAQRLRGIKIDPSAPTLILGKGGRDGEQIDLTEALSKRIPNWQEAQA